MGATILTISLVCFIPIIWYGLTHFSYLSNLSHFSSMSIEIKKPSHNLLDNLKGVKNRIAPMDDLGHRQIRSPAPMHTLPPRNLEPLVRPNKGTTNEKRSDSEEET